MFDLLQSYNSKGFQRFAAYFLSINPFFTIGGRFA